MNTLPQKLDFTFRVVVLLLTVTIGMMLLFIGARSAMAADLRTTAMISGDVFTVGDIFSGVSKETASRVLGPAPQPGRDMVLNARTLMRIAIALDLPWRPLSATDQVVVRRAATLVRTSDIRDLLKKALRDQGLGEHFDIRFTNTANPQMILPQNETATAEISALDYDPQHSTFEARLVAPSKEHPMAELTVAGQIERIVQVPVLSKTLSSGDIIDKYDIDWIELGEDDLQHDIVLNEDDLIGMTPHRVLVSGKPIRANELERPQLVGRGDTVMIVYNDKAMTLTAQGKAMQNGAKGDLIRVVNTSSSQSIDAFVEGNHLVKVLP